MNFAASTRQRLGGTTAARGMGGMGETKGDIGGAAATGGCIAIAPYAAPACKSFGEAWHDIIDFGIFGDYGGTAIFPEKIRLASHLPHPDVLAASNIAPMPKTGDTSHWWHMQTLANGPPWPHPRPDIPDGLTISEQEKINSLIQFEDPPFITMGLVSLDEPCDGKLSDGQPMPCQGGHLTIRQAWRSWVYMWLAAEMGSANKPAHFSIGCPPGNIDVAAPGTALRQCVPAGSPQGLAFQATAAAKAAAAQAAKTAHAAKPKGWSTTAKVAAAAGGITVLGLGSFAAWRLYRGIPLFSPLW